MYRSNVVSVAVLFAAPLVLFAAPLAQCAERSVDPSGSWRFTDEQGVASLLRIEMQEKGKVTGIYRGQGDGEVAIKNGRIQGNKLTLEVDLEIGGSKIHSQLTCEIDGDKLSGQSNYSGALGSGVSPISAQRAVLPEDVVGAWELAFTTQEGAGTAALQIRLDGKELKCNYKGNDGTELVAQRVGIKNNVFSFYIETTHDGGIVEVTFRGRPYGSRIKGDFEYDYLGNVGEIAFSGKRVAKKQR